MRSAPILQTLKFALRCRDCAASFDFYTRVLGLAVVDQWQEVDSTGCILALSGGQQEALLEISQVSSQSRRYRPADSAPLENDKIDLQLRTASLDACLVALEGVWPYDGPKTLPWGGRLIKLRDPDNLQVILYEGSL